MLPDKISYQNWFINYTQISLKFGSILTNYEY